MELLALLKIIDIGGIAVGVAWFLHWLIYEQKEIAFYKDMNPQRIWAFIRELGICFGTKVFGKASADIFFGSGFAFSGLELGGRLASRYAVVGGGSELAIGSYLHERAALVAFAILITLMLAEIWWQVYKNRELLQDGKAIGKLLLESYVVFGVVGMITSFYL